MIGWHYQRVQLSDFLHCGVHETFKTDLVTNTQLKCQLLKGFFQRPIADDYSVAGVTPIVQRSNNSDEQVHAFDRDQPAHNPQNGLLVRAFVSFGRPGLPELLNIDEIENLENLTWKRRLKRLLKLGGYRDNRLLA